jgi:hypothetical protein
VLVSLSRLRRLTWLAVAALVLPPLTLLPHTTKSTDIARVRNSLIFESAPAADFAWTPSHTPKDFLLDDAPPAEVFVAEARRLRLDGLPDDFQRALAISEHLLASQPRLLGGPVQASLGETYRRIVNSGEGYCADFVRVFQAFAVAAGMPMRAWAFSFDGFGGHGHIVVEIWNRQQGRWQMLDLYNNVYFPGDDGQPLDAMAVRSGFKRDPGSMVSMPLVPKARPGFKIESKLQNYYVAGIDEWYLWWGNNPFSYEGSAAVRLLSPVARPLAQAGAIVQGVHPKAVGLALDVNADRRQAMKWLAWQTKAVGLLMLLGLVLLCWALAQRVRAARRDKSNAYPGLSHDQ